MRNKKSIKAKIAGTAKKGEVFTEIAPPSEKWTKVKVHKSNLRGWALRNAVSYQPSLDVTDDAEADDFDFPERAEAVDGDLYNDEEGITGEDVQQGGLGDCWLLSPLAAIANTAEGKTLIRDMITDNGNGTFTVRFFIPVAEGSDTTSETYVTVDSVLPVLEDGSTQYAEKTDTNAIWPLIVEKAYAEVKGGFHAISGGFDSDAFLVVTGKRPDGYSLEDHANDTNNPSTQTDIGAMAALLKNSKGKAVSLSVPPTDREFDVTFKKSEDDWMAAFKGSGVRESTILITYENNNGASTQVRGKKGGIEVFDYPDEDMTIVSFKPKSVDEDDDLPATIWCQFTDIGDGLSGGHAYWLYDFEEKDTPEECVLSLTDPRKPDETVEVTLGDIYTTYKTQIYIGK